MISRGYHSRYETFKFGGFQVYRKKTPGLLKITPGLLKKTRFIEESLAQGYF